MKCTMAEADVVADVPRDFSDKDERVVKIKRKDAPSAPPEPPEVTRAKRLPV